MYSSIPIKNGQLSYYTLGEGTPLILLNGFSGTFLHWNKILLHEIAKNHKIYCLNYRGIGFSHSNDKDVSIDLLVDDLFQFMNALNLETCALLGYSMGGYIAQEFALHYPKRLAALYLVSTKAAGTKIVPTSPEITAKMNPREQSISERIEERLYLNFPANYYDIMRPIQRRLVEQYDLPECKLNLEMLQMQRDAIMQWQKSFLDTRYEEYSSFKFKTHIFCGLKDLIIPYRNSIILCELIPKSLLTIFEDGGHGILWQFGAEIGKMISADLSLL